MALGVALGMHRRGRYVGSVPSDADLERWSRRQWLAGAAAAGAGVLLAGCAGARPRPSFQEEAAPTASGSPGQPTGNGRSAAASAIPMGTAAAAAASAPGASLPQRFAWRGDEQRRLTAPGDQFDIVKRGSADATVLRSWARPVPAGLDLSRVEARMLRTMEAAKGVGLAAPQVGLRLRLATLKLDYKTDRPRTVFVRNPKIVERSDETIEGYEMCLSIPGIGGLVRRNRWIKIAHTAMDGETLTTEAEEHNAVLWQHELDHLDGVLYVDKVLGELLPADEVRRRREQQDGDVSALWPARGFGVFAATDCAEGTSLLRI